MSKPRKEPNDELKASFAMWLGLPHEARAEDEKTQDQWGKKYGITPNTLSRWKEDPHVHAIANGAVKMFFQNETFAIIQKMIEDAKAGDWHARRDYLEWQGELGSRTKDARMPGVKVTLERDTD